MMRVLAPGHQNQDARKRRRLKDLKYPMNDLRKRCTAPDLVNTVAVTAIQAQSEK
jgi:hypothetical protein